MANQYASFWNRLSAYNIDLMVVLVPLLIAGTTIDDNRLFYSIATIVVIVYHAAMESSKYQGTLGKMYHGLKVVNLDGTSISFGKALLRIALKFISAVMALLGFAMIAFHPRKQGFHDYILGTLVLVVDLKKTNNHSSIEK